MATRRGEIIDINQTDVKIIEVDVGIENSDKHIDTKLVVMVNDDRLVLHAYNGTQNLMVQGRNYDKFALDCLQPFFRNKIEPAKENITKFNNDVKDALGATKVVKRKPKKSYNCPQCETKALTTGDLKVHIKSCHTKPGINSPKRSKISKIVDEDTYLASDNDVKMIEIDSETEDDAVEMRENKNHDDQVLDTSNTSINIFECTLCEFSSGNENELKTHNEVKHKNMSEVEPVKVSDSIFVCPNCGEVFANVAHMQEHQKEHEIVIQMKYRCDFCDYETNQSSSVEDHGFKEHGTIKCDLCEYSALDKTIMKKHNTSTLPTYSCSVEYVNLKQPNRISLMATMKLNMLK